jgi:hypothetical protein
MIRSEHMKSCLAAQKRFLLFKGPGSFKIFFKICGNVDDWQTFRLIPRTPPLPGHFTVPLRIFYRTWYKYIFRDIQYTNKLVTTVTLIGGGRKVLKIPKLTQPLVFDTNNLLWCKAGKGGVLSWYLYIQLSLFAFQLGGALGDMNVTIFSKNIYKLTQPLLCNENNLLWKKGGEGGGEYMYTANTFISVSPPLPPPASPCLLYTC